jgi:hypothetical protein
MPKKSKPIITSRDLQRKFLDTVYQATKDPMLVTECHFIYDKNMDGKR